MNGGTSNLFNTNVTLGWTVFDGLGMFIAYDRLKTLREQQQQITRATVEETVEDITNAYYDVVREAGKIKSLGRGPAKSARPASTSPRRG